MPLKTHHLGRARWRQTDGHRNGGDQLPAPQEGDEPFSPGMDREGICPKGPTPAHGLCSGGCSPTAMLHPPAALGRETHSAVGVPVGQSPQRFPCSIPEGRRAERSPHITQPGLTGALHRAVLWGTGVLAAPSGLPAFPAPPRAVRLSLSLLLLVGKFDLSPLWSQHEELMGTSAGTPGKLHLTLTTASASYSCPGSSGDGSPWQPKSSELKPRLGVGVMCSHTTAPQNTSWGSSCWHCRCTEGPACRPHAPSSP